MDLPTPGRIVWYTSRTGKYFLPAIVTVTKNDRVNNLFQGGVDAGHIPDITAPDRAHLTVFSPGDGSPPRNEAADFVVKSEHGIANNQGGSYPEWDIGYDPAGAPGTWRWPDRS